MDLVAATGNRNKVQEFDRMLSPLGIRVLSPAQLGISMDVEETGHTFQENARIKALDIWEKTGKPVFADDSGLCVDALDGRPGVFSSRYYGENTPYLDKMNGLIRELETVQLERRTAQFVCAICCVLDAQTVLECQGICSGTIGLEPHGEGGFGYDPIFMVGSKSFAELNEMEKDCVSHRGKALRRFAQMLEEYIQEKSRG